MRLSIKVLYWHYEEQEQALLEGLCFLLFFKMFRFTLPNAIIYILNKVTIIINLTAGIVTFFVRVYDTNKS